MEFLNEALAKLAATPQKAAELVHGLTEPQLSWRAKADFFSLRENVLHLRDIDVEAYEERVRRVLNEECPALSGIEGGKLAIERNYNAQPIEPALDDLRRSRAASIELLRSCTDADLNRKAEMQGAGIIDLRRLLEFWMEHDGGHLKDMAELRRAIVTGSGPTFVQHQVA